MVSIKELSEEDIKIKYITPAIQKSNWDIQTQVRCEYYYTAGKMNVRENVATRGKRKFVDYLLSYKSNLPIAIIEAKDNNVTEAHGIQQAIGYAVDLDIPFAYSSNGSKFYEHDRLTGKERELSMEEFPTPEELWNRYIEEKELTEEQLKVITEPYYFMSAYKTPRYYQRIAINKTVEAIAKGQKRILLVMATGTGKTFTAFQIIHRLYKSGSKKKILYLADRNILIDQTMQNDFKPFQKVMTKVENRNMDSSYEIYMSLYHQLRSSEAQIYKQFKPDFFDLIIVDECHRSSARDDSNWHEILTYFNSATQIGMTATPKETNDVSNINYFGEPIYTYSLKDGIEDGFLAPYKVIKVSLDKDLEGYRPEKGKLDEDGYEVEDKEYTIHDFDRTIVIDERTQVVAKRITEYLKATDRYSRTIVFCVDTEHALRMRNALANENADMMQQNPNYVVRITSNDMEGKNKLDDFIDANTIYPVIATTSKLLSTGVDTKTVKLIALDEDIQSMTEFKQIIGRGTRLYESKGKEYFTIMDFRNNSEKFADPNFNGPAEMVLDVDGGDGKEPKTPKSFGIENDKPNLPISGDVDDEGFKKVYINGVDVSILNETIKYYDADGKLITESIMEYSKKNLKRMYTNYEGFEQEWLRADSKKEFVEFLLGEGVMVDALFDKVNDNVDVFDLLSNVAFDKEVVPKEERVEKVKESEEINQYNESQKNVIDEILNVYQNKGVLELENIRLLEVKNFNKFGGLVPIVNLFGGKEKYLNMINNVKRLLYS
ncbi:MAG TPA: DEAD/DEAH box helicase family protein [Candidatus Pelethosoma merdigallinarum]|jgi:ecoEI R, C-terminal domain protein|nr:DEAD/DEAH box helicase family protein [Candidatus Pelethosoma merdigallinarum]